MTRTANPAFDRLTAARPGPDGLEVVSTEERQRMLTAIVSADEPATARSSSPRRRIPLLALAVSAAAAAFASVLLSVGHSRPDGPASTVPAETGVDPKSLVIDRIRLAVSEAEGLILHVRTDYGNGVLWDAWFDATADRSRSRSSTPDGTPMYDHEFGEDDNGLWVRVVSHPDRAWWEYRSQGERAPVHGWSAADIRRHLDAGTLVEVAKEERDGRYELHLRWAPERAPEGVRMQPGDLWVDASTYLPLRSLADDRGRVVTMHFEWLERTPSNLAALDAPVPNEYRRLDGPPEQPVTGPGQG